MRKMRIRRAAHAASIPPRKGSGAAKRLASRPQVDPKPTTVAGWVQESAETRATVVETFRGWAEAIGLSKRRLTDATDGLLTLRVAAGRPLLPGEGLDFLSFVGDGCVKTVADVGGTLVTVQFARPGYFVPVAPPAGGGHFAAVAQVDSVVAVASLDLMRDILAGATPEQRLLLFAYHARTLSRLIADKTLLLGLTAKDRLMRELTELRRMFPGPEGSDEIALPLSHSDLAELVGVSREHITRTIVDLRREKRIGGTRQGYAVHRPWTPSRGGTSPPAAAGRSAGSPIVARGRPDPSATKLGLPSAVADVALRGATMTRYEPGATITPRAATEVSIVVQGAVRLMLDTGTKSVGVWVAKPWQFIAAGTFRKGAERPRAFWATAVLPTVVATCDHPQLVRALAMLSADELIAFLGHCHAALSRQLYARCVLLTQGNAERLFYELRLLAQDFPIPVRDGVAIGVPLWPRAELAALVSLTPAALTRALGDLEGAGLVRVDAARRIVVLSANQGRSKT
jgi:CRP-like cAMP-binding protein